jgi:hypothetical protein
MLAGRPGQTAARTESRPELGLVRVSTGREREWALKVTPGPRTERTRADDARPRARCGARWFGLERTHCAACTQHRTFDDAELDDAHRPDRTCIPPSAFR